MLRELSHDKYFLVPSNNTARVKFTFVATGTSTDLPETIEQVKELGSIFEPSGAYSTMVASEPILARDWLTPEEDEAWAHL